MKTFVIDTSISLNGDELFDEIFDAFQHGVSVGIEEANYMMIKKLANLGIDLKLISDLTSIPVEDVVCIVTEKDLDF